MSSSTDALSHPGTGPTRAPPASRTRTEAVSGPC